jgi:hypothetical protein
MSETIEPPAEPPPPAPLPQGTPPPPYLPPTCDCSDIPTFRGHFPEFADTTNYPDTMVQFFLDLGGVMCRATRWCELRQLGCELVCAHFLALRQYALLKSMPQGITGVSIATAVPGLNTGIPQSKSVSKVSVSMNLDLTKMEGAGPWNLTVYGQQYYWWLQIIGAPPTEMLAVGYGIGMEGMVNTWARGVMWAMGS